MPLLRASPFTSVEHLEEVGVVRITRTPAPFGDPRSARLEIQAWSSALSGLDTSVLGLLLDWRLTPMTSDPEILRAIVAGGDALALQFERHALLLSGSVSAPQSERISRAGSNVLLFTDERAAWEHVCR